MKKANIGILLTFLLIFSGCSNADPKITESEVETLVEQHHANSLGTVEITSVSYEHGQYVFERENEENCEWGVDYVDGQSGDIEINEATIC